MQQTTHLEVFSCTLIGVALIEPFADEVRFEKPAAAPYGAHKEEVKIIRAKIPSKTQRR
jgi:hypothetical protein